MPEGQRSELEENALIEHRLFEDVVLLHVLSELFFLLHHPQVVKRQPVSPQARRDIPLRQRYAALCMPLPPDLLLVLTPTAFDELLDVFARRLVLLAGIVRRISKPGVDGTDQAGRPRQNAELRG